MSETSMQQAPQEETPQSLGASLDTNIEKLTKYGGYDLLEMAVEKAQNLNPNRKARKQIFLTDESKANERKTLAKTLSMWKDVLSSGDKITDMVSECEENYQTVSETFTKNLKLSVETTKELEESYRSTALFYKNTEHTKVRNVTILNADLEQICDLDNTQFIDAIHGELVNNFDRLDLKNNYSLLVLPGYLSSGMVIEKWAKIAHENKVMLITDFLHLDEPDDVMEMFEDAYLTGGDIYRSNLMMTCNWLVGRPKFDEIEEQDNLYVTPSTALAGKVYKTLMSQVTAGRKFGGMNEVAGVKFDLKKSDIANLENLGLIPMVHEYGKVMAFSGKTLFNGDNLGLQTYSVVRVFDYVTKVLMDFLNRRAFENFTTNTRKDIMGQIVGFLDGITGPDKLIENFAISRFEQDPVQKDKVYLNVHLKPYFPAKNYLIKMAGHKGDANWDTVYSEGGE